MIEQLLPRGVVAVHALGDRPGVRLDPAEDRLTAAFAASRRAEFATGRDCARQALGELGVTAAVLTGEHREPLWPDGVVGSITHCDGYRAAAVAPEATVRSVGIDAEVHAPVPDEVTALVASASERAHLADLHDTRPEVCWDRVLFSAKESVYKAWFPLTGRWLGFDEAEVALDAGGSFGAALLVEGPVVGGRPLQRLDGRWTVAGQLVLTAVVVGR